MNISDRKFETMSELGIDKLTKYRGHRRLKVFYYKGLTCSMEGCTKVGTRLIKGTSKLGSVHVDIYTDDFELMNVDHYIPRSFGGSDHLDNLVPMCSTCNHMKGNKFIGVDMNHHFVSPTHPNI